MSGLSLSLAACARLEALWLVPLFAFLIWRRPGSRAAAWQRLLTLATPIVAVHGIHFLWRHSYYGTWLPNTFAAKVGVPRDVLFEHGFSYVSAFSFQAAPFFVLLVVCFRRLTRLERNEVLVPVAILIWWTAFVCVVGGDHFAFYRFFVPVFGLFAVLLTRISGAVLRRSQTRLKHAGLIAATALALNAWILFGPQTEPARSEVVQARAWARTGQWCASELPPGSVATLVAGAIPFYCDRETYDLLGLVDRHVATQGAIVPDAAVGHQKYDTPYILSREPKYIFFSMSGLLLRPVMESVENRRKLPGRTNQALIDLVTHPEVLAAYAYRAEPLGDGTWVEFLERRPIEVQRRAAGAAPTTH
jgi:hypothetical protein